MFNFRVSSLDHEITDKRQFYHANSHNFQRQIFTQDCLFCDKWIDHFYCLFYELTIDVTSITVSCRANNLFLWPTSAFLHLIIESQIKGNFTMRIVKIFNDTFSLERLKLTVWFDCLFRVEVKWADHFYCSFYELNFQLQCFSGQIIFLRRTFTFFH